MGMKEMEVVKGVHNESGGEMTIKLRTRGRKVVQR